MGRHPHAVRLEVRPLKSTNPVRSQQLIIATVLDEKGDARRKRRVEWMLEGVGNMHFKNLLVGMYVFSALLGLSFAIYGIAPLLPVVLIGGPVCVSGPPLCAGGSIVRASQP